MKNSIRLLIALPLGLLISLPLQAHDNHRDNPRDGHRGSHINKPIIQQNKYSRPSHAPQRRHINKNAQRQQRQELKVLKRLFWQDGHLSYAERRILRYKKGALKQSRRGYQRNDRFASRHNFRWDYRR